MAALNALYPGRSRVATAGETVVLYGSPASQIVIVLKPHEVYNHRFGAFHHDDMIGKPYGTRIFARGARPGFMHMLAMTPEMWTISLPHRTQIIYFVDISVVILNLCLRSGSVVVETGTGSGSLTTSLARTVAPTGHVHTFEFSEDRVKRAIADFDQLGTRDVVTVKHADAYGPEGFGEGLTGKADGVFLDLPQPWRALENTVKVMKPGARLCCYSPCIEQVQKTALALAEWGFEEVKTVEALGRYYNVDPDAIREPTMPAPLTTSVGLLDVLPKGSNMYKAYQAQQTAAAAAAGAAGAKAAAGDAEEAEAATDVAMTGATAAAAAAAAGGASSSSSSDSAAASSSSAVAGGKRSRAEFERGSASAGAAAAAGASASSSAVIPLQCKPFPAAVMKPQPCSAVLFPETRGHTAYLTFATLHRKPSKRPATAAAGAEDAAAVDAGSSAAAAADAGAGPAPSASAAAGSGAVATPA